MKCMVCKELRISPYDDAKYRPRGFYICEQEHYQCKSCNIRYHQRCAKCQLPTRFLRIHMNFSGSDRKDYKTLATDKDALSVRSQRTHRYQKSMHPLTIWQNELASHDFWWQNIRSFDKATGSEECLGHRSKSLVFDTNLKKSHKKEFKSSVDRSRSVENNMRRIPYPQGGLCRLIEELKQFNKKDSQNKTFAGQKQKQQVSKDKRMNNQK